ncbi:MAG: glycosyltransferase family 39 protein [Thermoanaerobaculia bacterium]
MRARPGSRRTFPRGAAASLLLRRPKLIVAAISLAVSLLFVAALPTTLRSNESSDYRSFYGPVAQALLAGRGFVGRDGLPATRYPPGYPLILAATWGTGDAFGVPRHVAIAALHLVTAMLSALLLFAIARTAWGLPEALLPPLLWITYPIALWLQKQPNSEMPFTVLLFGAVLLFLSAARRPGSGAFLWLACGISAGLAMLIRPIALGLGLVLAAAVFAVLPSLSRAAKARAAALLLAGNFLGVLPWEIWAHSRTERVIPLSTGGVASIRDGLTFAQRTRGLPSAVATLAGDLRGRYPEMRTTSGVARVLSGELADRPVAVLALFAVKTARSWYGTESRRGEARTLLLQLPYLLLGGLSLWFSRRGPPAARRLAVTVTLLVAYFWIMTIAALSILRYMVPAMGLLFTVAPAVFLLRRRAPVGLPDEPRAEAVSA